MPDKNIPGSADSQKPGWAFKPEQSDNETQQSVANTPAPQQKAEKSAANTGEVSWTASEFIANHKSAGWYILLFAAIFVVAGLTFLFTNDWISSATIIFVGSLFAILAGKKPRQISYSLNNSGITIGEKFYPYDMFKSFTILHEGTIGCINLLPLKRFMPEISIYYPSDEENKIIDVLTVSLPNNQKAEQGFDKLMKKIRF